MDSLEARAKVAEIIEQVLSKYTSDEAEELLVKNEIIALIDFTKPVGKRVAIAQKNPTGK